MERKFRRLGLFLLLVFLISTTISWAELPMDATLSYSAPLTYIDGTPLPPEEIDYYTAYYGTTSMDYTGSVNMGNVTEYRISDDLPNDGTYYCAVTVTLKDGSESERGNEVEFPLDRRVDPDAVDSLEVR